MRKFAMAVATGLGLLFPNTAFAVILDPAFEESLFATVPYGVTGLAWAPDESQRLFVTLKDGRVMIVDRGVSLTTPFAVMDSIYTSSECGLIGLAFDPDFATNGFVYFFVTVSETEQQIVRYRADGNTGVERTVIVPNLPTLGANHDGGALGFGPDGKLYFAIGDLGGNVGLDDLTTLAAKVARVNADGSLPEGNPFDDAAGPNNDYVWAQGFRNPFTLTFQPGTEALWVNVVGTSYEQIFVVRPGDDAGHIRWESDQREGDIRPQISYGTNIQIVTEILAGGAVREGGVAQFTTAMQHTMQPGQHITISGSSDPSFDAVGYVASVESITQFTMAQPGPDAQGGGGAVTTDFIGGCVTGGTFWDSTSVPATHRGNFFFGDFNSGAIVRAVLDTDNEVDSVDVWGNNLIHVVDTELGPDGSLYFGILDGQVYRARYTATEQALVVSRLHLRTNEGGRAVFHVRLATEPLQPLSVTVARSSNNRDLVIESGETHRFGPDDWSEPRPVTVRARFDADTLDDLARFDVAAIGLPSVVVEVRVTDSVAEEDPGAGGSAGAGGMPDRAGAAGHAEAGEGGREGPDGPQGGAGGVNGGAGGAGNADAGAEGSGTAGASGGAPPATGSGNGGSDAGEAGDDRTRGASSNEGCGCRTSGRATRPWLGVTFALAWLLRRRLRR